MNWVSKRRFALTLILGANAFGGTPTNETTMPLPRIGAGVYNLARVERDILEGAKEQAARILGRAGVKIDWQDCPVSAEEVDEYSGCAALGGDTAIFLRVRASTTRLSGRPNVYGVALLPKDGGFGKYADVYADAGVVAQRGKMPASVFLGTLLAHEIGHLLLERASHSASGIMSSPWRAGDLVLAAQGSLLFTAKEASLLRDGVRGRLRADETLDDASRFMVRLYNYAEVDSVQLRKGISTASEVFHAAGIQLVWAECSVARLDVRKNSVCGQFDGTPWAQLRLLPREMAQRLELDHEMAGVAVGRIASVVFHRVQELSGQLGIPESLALGHIMAHELGHVLLGPGGHSPAGVMKATLLRTDHHLVTTGSLRFSSAQAARMQAHLRRPTVAISSAPLGGSVSAPERAGRESGLGSESTPGPSALAP